MARILFLFLSVFCQSLFAQTITDWEQEAYQYIEKAVNLTDPNQKIDELSVMLYDWSSSCVAPTDPAQQLGEQRIRSRIVEELKRLPGSANRQEQRIKEALAAIRSGKTEAEMKAAYQELKYGAAGMVVVYASLNPPGMMGSIKRTLEDARRTFKETPQTSEANWAMRQIYGLLLTQIEYVSFQQTSAWDLEQWTTLLSLTEGSGFTFKMPNNPNEYDLNGSIRAARNPNLPLVTGQLSTAANDSPESSKQSKPLPAPWIAGIIAILLALGGWLFIRKQAAS